MIQKGRSVGQALTEYVLLIAILSGIILALARTIETKLRPLFEAQVANYISGNLQGGGVYRFYFAPPGS